MPIAGRKRRRHIAGTFLLLIVVAGAVAIDAPASPNTASQLLARAEDIKVTDNAGFTKLLEELEGHIDQLSEAQRWQLRYLQ